MRNSDHYDFVSRGIPAMRVVTGFDEPESGARYLLTSGDTREGGADGAEDRGVGSRGNRLAGINVAGLGGTA